MRKFRFANSEIWFGYTEDNKDKAIAIARRVAEVHPLEKVIYDDDKLDVTDNVSSDGYPATPPQHTLPKRVKSTETTEETIQLSDMSSDLDRLTPDGDSLG
jgi:hypothetical protein